MSVTPSSSSNHSFILRFLFLLALPLVLTTLGSAYLFSVMQKNTLLNTMRFFNDSTGQQWDNSLSSVERQINIIIDDIKKKMVNCRFPCAPDITTFGNIFFILKDR